MRIVLGISVALLAASVDAGRYDSYQKRQITHEVCRKAGDLAANAKENPEQAHQTLAEIADHDTKLMNIWRKAIYMGLESGSETPTSDLYMRGWAYCMDILD